MLIAKLNRNGTRCSKGFWLSGIVLDSRLRGHGFEPRGRHCLLSLSKTHLSLLSTGSTQEDPSRHNWKIVDWDVKNQIIVTINQTIKQTKGLMCGNHWLNMHYWS